MDAIDTESLRVTLNTNGLQFEDGQDGAGGRDGDRRGAQRRRTWSEHRNLSTAAWLSKNVVGNGKRLRVMARWRPRAGSRDSWENHLGELRPEVCSCGSNDLRWDRQRKTVHSLSLEKSLAPLHQEEYHAMIKVTMNTSETPLYKMILTTTSTSKAEPDLSPKDSFTLQSVSTSTHNDTSVVSQSRRDEARD